MLKYKPLGQQASNASAHRAKLSASHRGPRPGKQQVQKAPKTPSFNSKVKF